jgi:hypothetical protein
MGEGKGQILTHINAWDLVLLVTFYHIFKYSQALSVLRRPISLEYKELLCAAEHMLRHIAPQSIPCLTEMAHYWS